MNQTNFRIRLVLLHIFQVGGQQSLMLLVGLPFLQRLLFLLIALEHVDGRPLQINRHIPKLPVGQLLECTPRLLPLRELNDRAQPIVRQHQPLHRLVQLKLGKHLAQILLFRVARQVLDQNSSLTSFSSRVF